MTAVLEAMLDAAVEYARRGVPVFPVWGVKGDRCCCGRYPCGDDNRNAGKHPVGRLAPNGFKDASTDEAQIRAWWEQEPHANIAMPTGILSVVIDVDPRHGGDKTLSELERCHGALPDTPEVLTGGGGGGRHIHFAPPPVRVPNSEGKLGPGLDIRGHGGYVLLPPSRHVSGGVYRDNPNHPLFETPLAPMPQWLLALATAHSSPNGAGRQEETDWAKLLAGAPEGQRHAHAARIAGHFLGKRLTPSEVEQIVLGFAARCSPSFPPAEVRRIVHDLAEKDRACAADDTAVGDSVVPLGIGVGQFLAGEFPPAEPYIADILSDDGGGWLGGEEKLGKTYYALEEALCLALGVHVCGRFAVPKRRRVLFIEEEDPPRRTHRRLRALIRGHGFDPDDPAVRMDLDAWFCISAWEGFSLDELTTIARLETTLITFRPEVCYIDVLRKVTLADLNKAVEAGTLLARLDSLRRKYGVVFRIVHHYRKVQGFRSGRGSQEIGGSYVLGAWGENSLFFEPVGRKQGAVRVEVQSKDAPPVPGFTLRLEAEGPRHAPTAVRLVAEEVITPSENVDEVVAQAIATLPKIEAITGKPGVTKKAVIEAIRKSDKTVRRALDRLIDAQRIVVTGRATKLVKLYGENASDGANSDPGHGLNDQRDRTDQALRPDDPGQHPGHAGVVIPPWPGDQGRVAAPPSSEAVSDDSMTQPASDERALPSPEIDGLARPVAAPTPTDASSADRELTRRDGNPSEPTEAEVRE